ncbi:hypothetical protein DM02DRAFT_695803, partial [Periconia macrospinosa]
PLRLAISHINKHRNPSPQPVAIDAIAEASIKFRYFEHVAEYSVAVCRECGYSVLPSYIESYLQRIYRLK